MNVSVKEAQDSLEKVAQFGLAMQRSVMATYTSGYMILWGLIWIIAFGMTHFMPERSGWIWMVLGGIGVLATVIIAILQVRQGGPYQSSDADKVRWRIMGFWFLLCVYAVIWLMLLKPVTGMQMGAFISTVAMFAYVVKGLWFESNFLICVGLAVSAATLVGYYLAPDYFSLWMAPAGGGALLACGLYIRIKWI